VNWFKKHKIITAILALVVVGGIISAAGGGGDTNNSSSNGSTPAAETASNDKQSAAKIGTAVRDGKFEFVVKSVECGKKEVVSPETDALRKTAQGQFCFMTLSVKNIGNEQQYFSESDQKLLNAEGQQFSPDSTATLYNSNNQDVWLAQINPGNSVEGVLVFDVPADAKVTQAQLHDSAFSGGVKVNL
jgi:hypothetical protein